MIRKGATAVQFLFGGKCPEGGFIEMDRDARFRAAKLSGGKDRANMMVGRGSWAYRLRCSSGAGDSGAGRVGPDRRVARLGEPRVAAAGCGQPDRR